MKSEQWSAASSIVAALVVTLASFRQWVTVTMGGELQLRRWAKLMLWIVVALLFVALGLLLYSVFG